MIKKIFPIVFLAVLFSGCSSDDDNSGIDPPVIDYNELPRRWYYQQDIVGGQTIQYNDHEACGKDYIEFVEDGTLLLVDVFDCPDGPSGEPATDTSEAAWTREGDIVTLIGFGESFEYTIVELTSSRFEITSTYDYDEDGDEETVTEIYTSTP